MRIVTTTPELEDLCAGLSRAPYVALDTEFLRDQTYWPKLCLIQLAAPALGHGPGAEPGIEAIVDPMAPGLELGPFRRLLAHKGTVKVMHAARQDIEIFHQQGGVIPDPLFDTQIAAMVCGFGDAASYETLARRIAKVEIDKSARFTDWSRRPLSKRQLEYALADVTHLRRVYEHLARELDKTGRAPWVEEELSALKDPALYRLDPEQAWRRLKPRTHSRKFLAVLAAIATWREREAQTRDVPRNRIVKDEALLEIAAHPPENAEALDHIRAVPRGWANSRQGQALLKAVAEGLAGPPPEDLPPPDHRRRGNEPAPAALDLLKTLLRLRANEFGVAARLVATSDDLEKLAGGDNEGVAALHGWRADVFGNDARLLRDGKLAIALRDGHAVVIETGIEE